jgi:hypothetical protein
LDWAENDTYGLELVVEHDGEKHRIDATFVESMAPFAEEN